jgi:hypothetical protein
VVAELDRVRPSIVLIEGPADADPLLALTAAPGMSPPVALLGYLPEAPRVSAFWPYAVFSPEWQALLWAARNSVTVRFCDLPASTVLAEREDRADATGPTGLPDDAAMPEAGHEGDETEPDARSDDHSFSFFAADPIGELATAAGYDDPERWWDDVIESRAHRDPAEGGVFDALTDAMAELRSVWPQPPPSELRREAHMRQVLRGALRETGGTVAVVCGAWHGPALRGPLPSAAADAALLRGIPKRKAALAWVPWTHSRLAAASGYGAGITSPGWYHHLFTTPEQTVVRWLTRVGAVLRDRDLPVSSAHVIEGVRLAEALAVLRGRPLAGLTEVSEATLSVLCSGDEVMAGYVTRDLVVGEALGTVPDDAPPVPLDADLRAQARVVKLKFDPLAKTLDLDLRRELDRARAEFLHRLSVLGIGWGVPTESTVRSTGTFRETWTLTWRPELSVAVIDAAVWGTTVAGAATAKIVSVADAAVAGTAGPSGARASLADVTDAVSQVLLAGLPEALPIVLRALDAVAAGDADVASLMTAVPSLVSAIRYGNVRGTPVSSLAAVVDALVVRICAGLPAAVGGLADDAATALRVAMDGLHAALVLYGVSDGGASGRGNTGGGAYGGGAYGGGTDDASARARWLAALRAVADRQDVHGLVAGRAVRMLADAGSISWGMAAVRFGAALSVGVPAGAKAQWVEGFVSGGTGGAGSGLLLVHDRDLLGVLDGWVASLDADEFLEVLPLLRRTFGEFAAPERDAIGRAVRSISAAREARQVGGTGIQAGPWAEESLDAERAVPAVRTVAAILGGVA